MPDSCFVTNICADKYGTWTGRGMRQHVPRGWEHVIMPIDGKAWISLGCWIAALLRTYGQIITRTGRGMRQHVMGTCDHANRRESMLKSGLHDSCFDTNICADKYMNRTRHAPASVRGWEYVIMPIDGKAWIRVRVAWTGRGKRQPVLGDGNTWSCHHWRESMDKSPGCLNGTRQAPVRVRGGEKWTGKHG